jgi:ParB family chromosome partitioning protein
MNNKERNVHTSGALGMLIKTGQITPVDIHTKPVESSEQQNQSFKTKAGIKFNESELVFVDPKTCEPWKYANRHETEMGEMEDLIDSIRENKQLQPGLIRIHPAPHGEIKYEIIFGRRRHQACLKIGIPFMAIKKDIPNTQEAIVSQDAENKFRNNVSDYSNAILYEKLISDGVFKTENELAKKLNVAKSSFSELMSYNKIPNEIVKRIPNIHNLSKIMALKIVSLLDKQPESYNELLNVAPYIGVKVTSPAKLENALKQNSIPDGEASKNSNVRIVKSQNGKKLFTFKQDSKGKQCIVFHSDSMDTIDYDHLCEYLRNYLEKRNESSDIRTLEQV